MSLQEEIDVKRAEIKTDSYSMSIGELINLYNDKEIDIHPEFQRFFRWSTTQKTKLIESILLGIPLPPIFVSQRQDGIWDVVDGLQRLSTIFQFVGILKDENNSIVDPLVLEGTDDLPSLKSKIWGGEDQSENDITPAQRLAIKRSKIDVNIILKESDENSKYELFQRLNTGGSPLSDQEVRNCLLIMENKKVFTWLKDLSRDNNFRESIVLTDRSYDEQYDIELALRFIIFRTVEDGQLGNIGDLNEYLNKRMLQIARDQEFDYEGEGEKFRRTFELINKYYGSDAFRKFDTDKNKFVGGFLVTAFEVIAIGVGSDPFSLPDEEQYYQQKITELWSDADFASRTSSGVRASTRIPRTIGLGRRLYQV